MTGTAAVAAARRQRRRRRHRVPRRRRRLGPQRQHRRREPVRDGVHGLGRGPAHGRVPLGRQGGQRRGDEDRSRSASTRPTPASRSIEAFADPRSGSAPLLVRYSATGFDPDGGALSYEWEFEDGSVFGARAHAHLHAGRHVHGEADRDRRRGRQDDQGGRRHRHRAGRASRRRSRRPPTSPAAPRRCWSASAPRATTRTGPRTTCTTAGSSATAARRSSADPSHTYMQKGTYQAKVTVSDASGATATKTLEIVVGDPPGNLAPSVAGGRAAAHRLGAAGGAAERRRHRSRRRRADLLVGLRRRQRERDGRGGDAHLRGRRAPTPRR